MRKKTVSLCMAAIMFMAAFMPINAADGKYTNEQLADNVIEFGELEILIHSNNTTVVNNQYAYKDLREARADTIDLEEGLEGISPSGNIDVSDYRQQISEYEKLASRAETQEERVRYQSLANALTTEMESKVANAQFQAYVSAMSMGGSISAQQLQDYKMQFAQAEAQVLKSAQGMFPNYYQLEYSLQSLMANRELLNATYENKKIQLAAGMCTQYDVTAAKSELDALDYNITSMQSQMVTLKQELCKMIGKSYDANIAIGSVPEIDWDYVANIDLELDKEKAVKVNYAVRIQVNKKENVTPSTTATDKATVENNLAEAQEKARSQVAQQYQNIQLAISDLNLQKQKLQQMEETNKINEAKYAAGLISRFEHDSQSASYTAQDIAVKTAELTLVEAINTYKWYQQGL